MSTTVEKSPAVQVRDYIITRLRALSIGLQQGQIRGLLDVSDERPMGTEAVIVSAVDAGGHAGLPGRTLVDVEATVSIVTHLDEDEDGTRNDHLESEVMLSLSGISNNTSLTDWDIRFSGVWLCSEATIVNETFRKRELTATLFLQAKLS